MIRLLLRIFKKLPRNESTHYRSTTYRMKRDLFVLMIGLFLIAFEFSPKNELHAQVCVSKSNDIQAPSHDKSSQSIDVFVLPVEYTESVQSANPVDIAGRVTITTLEVEKETGLPEDISEKDEDQENLYNPFAERVEYNPCIEPDVAPFHWKLTEHFLETLSKPEESIAELGAWVFHAERLQPHTELDEHVIGIQPIPDRPNLFLETEEDFLSPGFLKQGIRIPTGAVWRPAFWVFGQYRTGISYSDNQAGTNFTEWSNRLDLFGQMNLTGTERLLVGIRPLDQEMKSSREFTSYDFRDGQSIDGWNSDIQTLFFEGDIGEIFPNLDPYDVKEWDIGFSVGRQPLSFQQGLLINEDMIDAVTVTRNTLSGHGALNIRSTFVYGQNNINRNNNVHDNQAQLVGIFTETDTSRSTINADVAYVNSENSTYGSVLAVALSGIQRFHGFHNTYNTSFHALASFPTDHETAASGQGELLFSQISWTAHESQDLIYLNSFWAIDQFTSPARGPLAGGPLGQTGILFAAPGLGRFGSPLSNQASNAFGGSLGYQMFYNDSRDQLIVEIGGRKDTNQINEGAIATGFRYQKAIGRHWIFILDGFVSKQESRDTAPGTRVEFLAKF